MGEWSPENIGGEWQDGGSGKVGDRYIGHNRTAERAWSVPVMVTIADRGRCFAFVTRPDEGPYVRWAYVSFRQSTPDFSCFIRYLRRLPSTQGLALDGEGRQDDARAQPAQRLSTRLPAPQGMALLARVPASNGSDAARDRVPPGMRATLPLPAAAVSFFFPVKLVSGRGRRGCRAGPPLVWCALTHLLCAPTLTPAEQASAAHRGGLTVVRRRTSAPARAARVAGRPDGRGRAGTCRPRGAGPGLLCRGERNMMMRHRWMQRRQHRGLLAARLGGRAGQGPQSHGGGVAQVAMASPPAVAGAVPGSVTLTPPKGGEDAYPALQSALTTLPAVGEPRLAAGTYYCSGTLDFTNRLAMSSVCRANRATTSWLFRAFGEPGLDRPTGTIR